MAVEWTRHRFSGGTLVLDAANTVVHRSDPARRFDRFGEPSEIGRFADIVTGRTTRLAEPLLELQPTG